MADNNSGSSTICELLKFKLQLLCNDLWYTRSYKAFWNTQFSVPVCHFPSQFLTFSSMLRATPISSCSNTTQPTVPSQEHARRKSPRLLHEISRTLSSKKSFMTTKGRFNDVNQTLMERSREPMAQQQYWVDFLGLSWEGFFRMLELKRWKTKANFPLNAKDGRVSPHTWRLCDAPQSLYPVSNLLAQLFVRLGLLRS